MTRTLNGYALKKNGWTYISVHGDPEERGYAYGYFCAKDFKDIQTMLKFFMMESYGFEWSTFIREVNKDYHHFSKTKYPEFYKEMVGIAKGCTAGGTPTDIDEILAWNFYLSIPYWLLKKGAVGAKEGGGSFQFQGIKKEPADDHCSAFIAVGKDWTTNGQIVVAHNSFAEYVDGQYLNVILDMQPTHGAQMLIQTSPCWIWSGSDFFVTSYGIIGTETTIGGFNQYEQNIPLMFRIRQAMQYGQTMDEYVELLLKGNSGDYANSWFFGDIKTNEILRLELGLKYHNVERTKNGCFIGFNSTYDPRIRNLECENTGFYDTRRHQGARLVRLGDLMEQHKGKLNIELAKELIADHYDVYLHKENNPNSRTVCSHYDEDAREFMSQADRPKPFAPRGATDGCAADTECIRNMSFWARYGRSCGEPFEVKSFINKNRQYKMFEPYLRDRPSEPWTLFTSNRKKMVKKRKRGGSSRKQKKSRVYFLSNVTKRRRKRNA
jgi:hypothetical protein